MDADSAAANDDKEDVFLYEETMVRVLLCVRVKESVKKELCPFAKERNKSRIVYD